MIPAKAGWAVDAWRLPQALHVLHQPCHSCLLEQHSSSPALPGGPGTISHVVAISTGLCYPREEAGIMGKNLHLVGTEPCFLRSHPAVENTSEKVKGGTGLLLQVAPALSHSLATQIHRQRCKAGPSCCLWLSAEEYQHFPGQNKYDLL